jgi:CheY-like chemotaxis protein
MPWNILVVDDEPDNLKLITSILEEHATCHAALNGSAAVAAFKKAAESNNFYDLILLDVAMPGKDGLQVLEEIRKYEEAHGILLGKGTPIIMVTAHPSAFMKSFNRGCDDFILKPVDGKALIKKISALISLAQKAK